MAEFEFTGELWFWRGPAPFHFVTVPELEADDIKDLSAEVTYGWGMIPVAATIGTTDWETALWPKDGRYIVPIKKAVRVAEKLELGDRVAVAFDLLRNAD